MGFLSRKSWKARVYSCYNFFVTASYTGDRKGVSSMELFTSLIIAVAGGVICHYIIKWLDGDK